VLDIFNQIWSFLESYSCKSPVSDSTEICSVGAALILSGQTNEWTWSFSWPCECA